VTDLKKRSQRYGDAAFVVVVEPEKTKRNHLRFAAACLRMADLKK
jgi:hypothetical protein